MKKRYAVVLVEVFGHGDEHVRSWYFDVDVETMKCKFIPTSNQIKEAIKVNEGRNDDS